jgi:hypothetical protein
VRIYISNDNGLSKTVIMKSAITLIFMIMGSHMSFLIAFSILDVEAQSQDITMITAATAMAS